MLHSETKGYYYTVISYVGMYRLKFKVLVSAVKLRGKLLILFKVSSLPKFSMSDIGHTFMPGCATLVLAFTGNFMNLHFTVPSKADTR
jgi:hypothetical protein